MFTATYNPYNHQVDSKTDKKDDSKLENLASLT